MTPIEPALFYTMQVLFYATQVMLWLIISKSIIGYRFSWEPIVKTKKALKNDLDSIKGCIPALTYESMQKLIEQI